MSLLGFGAIGSGPIATDGNNAIPTPGTVALTGVAATAAAGTVAPSITVAITGVEATSAVGTVTAGQPLTGVNATSSVGSITPSSTVPLTGIAATAAVGSVSAATAISLSGVSASGSPGTVTGSLGASLSGVEGDTSVGNITASTAIGLTGDLATGAVGTVTPITGVTVAVTGVSATGNIGAVVPDTNVNSTGVEGDTSVGNVSTVPIPIIIDDTHDGDYHKKKFEEERATAKRKKEAIIQAYERLVEGKPDVAEEIAAPYIAPPTKKQPGPTVNFDKLLADAAKAEQLWLKYLEMDDEDVLMLL